MESVPFNDSCLFVGASVRAVAASAARAGYTCFGIDRFEDRDLQEICHPKGTRRIEKWSELRQLAATLPSTPWMFTGPLENLPALIEEMSDERPLWGTPATAVLGVRDLRIFSACLLELGLPFPETYVADRRFGAFHDPAEPRWLDKPLRSAGGAAITWALPEEIRSQAGPARDPRETHCRQRFVPGQAVSGIFCAFHGACVFLGATLQLTYQFLYAGSLAPLPHPPGLVDVWERLGTGLAECFELRGLFGVDAIYREHDLRSPLVPLEVNPRYTASVEVWERVTGLSAFRCHRHAIASFFGDPSSNDMFMSAADWRSAIAAADKSRCAGKQIVYARRDHVADDDFVAGLRVPNSDPRRLHVADIPRPGTRIHGGEPLCTVFADGANLDAVRLGLDAVEASLRLER